MNFNGNSSYGLNDNSFSDCSLMNADFIMPALVVAPWKGGISQAAMVRGTGVV